MCGEFTKQDMAEIREKTKLNSAYVQQCRDQALWMWRSYRTQHRDWERQLKHAKGKWRGKLLKREPLKPFHNSLTGKVPVRIDVRTGIVVSSNRMKLSPYVLCLSTFSKNHRIIVPLNPAKYHLDLLRKGRRRESGSR
jgi:putative transposase